MTLSRAQIKRRCLVSTGVIAAILLIDQIVKIWVKTHFYLGEDYEILPFFHIHFIQKICGLQNTQPAVTANACDCGGAGIQMGN